MAMAIRCQLSANGRRDSGGKRVGNIDSTILGMMLMVQWMAIAAKMLVLVLRNRTVMTRLKQTTAAENLKAPSSVPMMLL